MLWCEDDELCADMKEEDLQLARELLAEERALLKLVQQARLWRADGGTNCMVKLSEAVAAYAGAVSEHQLMVAGIKWSKHTAAELLTQYPAAT
eukprot:7042-Heterococcus_DN1.PRE.1